MATAETVDLGSPHAPKEESIKAYEELEADLKKELLHLKHTYHKHEPEYFAAVQHLSDEDLAGFTSSDFDQVRVAMSAYGLHIFGRVRIPAMAGSAECYIFFRAFQGGGDDPAKLHSIHTEESDDDINGGKKYRAIFTPDDVLEWFDT